MADIQGHCPACGGATLFVGDGGHLTCSLIGCPNPSALDTILQDGETQHRVTFDANGFTIRHPLIERVGHQLEECDLHRHCIRMSGPPVQPGTYRAHRCRDQWVFTAP